ncbi:MAG TPA: indole-3-glycerol phosphate synthase TrpC [Candidatus Methanofastidiosa archaeon]|nr:indole-3-glycerol phosphate synthase TrpC [Candidatus Methanofastidiosa archaeon]
MVHFGFGHTINVKKGQKLNPIIAEIKVHSPMHGDMLGKRDPMDVLGIYESCDVAGISYITAGEFNGDASLLRKICSSTDLPVLRKDFIMTASDVEETSSLGARGILLIARMLKGRTPEFVELALEHGLEPLVEVHSYDDIQYANASGTKMVAINNRDITMFEKDRGNVEVTERLHHFIDKKRMLVSASGIETLNDLKRAMSISDAALVGTAFMQAVDIEGIVRSFVGGQRC